MKKLTVWTLLLFLLFSVHALTNLYWINLNNAPLPWDSANHLFISISVLEKIKSLDFLEVLKVSNYYPILVHTISALILLFTGVSIKIGQFLGTIYFIFTLLIIYLYLKNISNSFIAFFSTLFVSLSPIFFNQSRQLMLDIPSVGFLFLSLYFFQKSQCLKKLKPTLYFFIAAGCLGMTKWTGLIYLSVPAFLTLVNFYRQKSKIVQLKNAFLGMIVFGLVTLPWYLSNLNDLLYLGKIYSVDHSNPDGKNIWQLENFRDYLNIFIRDQVTPIPALVFLVCLPIYLFIKNKFKWFVISMILVNYLIFSLLGNKDSRFTMHLLVFVFFIVLAVLDLLIKRMKTVGILMLSFLSIFMISYFLVLSFRPSFFTNFKYPINIPILGRFNVIEDNNLLSKKVDLNTWSMDQVIEDLKSFNLTAKNNRVLVVSEWEHFNPSNLRTYGYVSGLTNLNVVTADIVFLKERYNDNQFPIQAEMVKFLKENDYILIVENDLGSPILLNGKALNQIKTYVYSDKQTLCRDFVLGISPPGQSCLVKDGEVLISSSDILIDRKPVPAGIKEIKGYAEVYCQWGCSFGVAKSPQMEKQLQLQFVKTYILPNKEKLNLFRII
ncbi:MAG: hypothetical protein ACD_31C00008G0018 [uncultured bacterium]|uniref:ArnT-like N-terminal domain-containing protein n=4 Tax=Candidatus Daviesiibacteriota TaxID=1752718 RepID=A0A0G0ERL1_9BACT|nr:MAG: hypothetical protein ACD_31C00008G0018 [uncultured bacterium]KKQ08107.1 MAG: hypothetical protein US19_C0031G0007 [Candidatus Daviesbacteria bacterium GW2011_GWB1_36_5]KKQ16417.1 MAG: hypothetical protein US28_C0001G0007 [Candidatus Daviesbacteria bacterium GW2011_GWA1_36_8]OGE16702.1 MAG: hypothetical protein A2858_02600 [Candidatus Daviesbacteria bacterium RIFCSPHIGHO2_01_FULL_36_37]OGE34779.1 MAG: hypothetical protein A3E66_04120 [Candidatus Daviesbacteria bacterium RIFCSPHIGHO2_12_F